jgi:hypothetical protein
MEITFPCEESILIFKDRVVVNPCEYDNEEFRCCGAQLSLKQARKLAMQIKKSWGSKTHVSLGKFGVYCCRQEGKGIKITNEILKALGLKPLPKSAKLPEECSCLTVAWRTSAGPHIDESWREPIEDPLR